MDGFDDLRKEFSLLAADKLRDGASPYEVFMALQAGGARIAQPALSKKEYMEAASIAFDSAMNDYLVFREQQKTEN